MTAAEGPVVVGHGIQIVDGGRRVGPDDVVGEVQGLQGIGDEGLQLLTEVLVAVAEPLEVNHEDARGVPQVELLGRLPVFLASVAIPRVVWSQPFCTCVQREAFVQRQLIRIRWVCGVHAAMLHLCDL